MSITLFNTKNLLKGDFIMNKTLNKIRNISFYILFFVVFGTIGAVLGLMLAEPVYEALGYLTEQTVSYSLPDDVYGYNLADNFAGETALYGFNENERNIYYRLRNLYIAVGTGESDVLDIRYNFPESVEKLEDACDINKVVDAVRNHYDGYAYWRAPKMTLNTFGEQVDGVIIGTTANIDFELPGSNGKEIDIEKIRTTYQNVYSNAREIIAEADGLSDYDKIIHYINRLIYMTDYDNHHVETNEPTQLPHTMINALDGDENTLSVCNGYSYAFQFLCDNTKFENNIRVYTVLSEVHAWNVVKMEDGLAYVVDITYLDGNDKSESNYFAGLSENNGVHQTIKLSNTYESERVLMDFSYTMVSNLKFADSTYYQNNLEIGYDPNAVPMN